MDILYKVGSGVLLLVGVIYPLAAIYMMMKFLGREDLPRPSPAYIMLHFVLMATVPLAGILGGFAGFAPTLWQSQVIRMIVYGAGVLSLAAFAMLLVNSRAGQPDGNE
jgi:hypothetical protein